MLPWDALVELANHYGVGAKKYPARNWEQGMKWNENVAASLMRHLAAWSTGEDIDKENGAYHDTAILWNAIALVTYRLRGIGTDDRYKLTPVGDNIPGHPVKGNDSNPVAVVPALNEPTPIITTDNNSYMVRPDNHNALPGTRWYSVIDPVTGEVVCWIGNT